MRVVLDFQNSDGRLEGTVTVDGDRHPIAFSGTLALLAALEAVSSEPAVTSEPAVSSEPAGSGDPTAAESS